MGDLEHLTTLRDLEDMRDYQIFGRLLRFEIFKTLEDLEESGDWEIWKI